MRNLVTLVILVSVIGILPAVAGARHFELYPSAEEVLHNSTESRAFLIALGSLKRVNHQLQAEGSMYVAAEKEAFTYYLPVARKTSEVVEYFKSQLSESAQVLFECEGRSCGSSSYWANDHFEQAILYGPEQYQQYFVVEDDDDYVVVYVGQRATRKIYAYIEYISKTAP